MENEPMVDSMLPWMGWSGPVNLALSQAMCVELRRIGMAMGDGGVTLQMLLAQLFADRPDLRAEQVNARLATALLTVDGERIWAVQQRRRRSGSTSGTH
jgi:hypothetical protein